jgi:hypothetical protein
MTFCIFKFREEMRFYWQEDFERYLVKVKLQD